MKFSEKSIAGLVILLTTFSLLMPGVDASSQSPFILAGSGEKDSCNPNQPRDLVLLIDQSASLNEPIEDGKTRQEKLIEALLNLDLELFQRTDDQAGDQLSQINVGIIQFAKQVETLRELQKGPLKAGEFEEIVEQLDRNSDSLQGGTNYLDAIDDAINQLSESRTDDRCQTIVWFTDGELNLETGSPIAEVDRLKKEFCGYQGSNSASVAQLLREQNIQTFVIYLSKQSELPKRRPSDTENIKELTKFDSIESLRAITGDWKDKEKGADREIKPFSAECGGFNDDLGELIFVDRAEDLIYQLLVGASNCVPTSQTLKMPSSKLIKRLEVYFEGTGAKGNLIVAPFEKDAPQGGSKIVIGQDELKDVNGVPLPAGWEIQFGADFETCIGLAWVPNALEVEGTPIQTTYSMKEALIQTQPIKVNLNLTDFIDDVEAIDDDSAIRKWDGRVSGENQIEFFPKVPGAIEFLPGTVRLTPKGVDEAVLLKLDPIYATVRLSPPVVVTGAADVPALKCGAQTGEDGTILSLPFRHVDGELSDDILASNQKCEISNLKSGIIEVRWKIKPRSVLSKNGQWEIRSGEQLNGQMITFNSTDGDARDFDFVFNEAVDGTYIPQADRSGVLEVQWINNGTPLITWSIDAPIDVDLKKPADRFTAVLFALLISLIAALLSYLLLYVILWKTATVGKPGQARYRVERRTVGRNFSNKDIEIDSAVVTSLKPTSGDSSGRSLIAGDAQLSAKVAALNHPLKVLRGAWTDISMPGSNVSARPSGPEPLSTIAPLRPSVIARLLSFQIESDKYEVEYTFLLPNGNSDLAGLIGPQREATKVIIERAGSSTNLENSAPKSKSRLTQKSSDDNATEEVIQTLPPLPFRPGGTTI